MNGIVMRRTSAFFVLMALMAAITVIGAPGALAHHPEVSASSSCEGYEPVISFSAESWATGSKGSNANIGIYVDGQWQAAGAFSSENGYAFSGTIAASAWAGKTVTVMARADGPWGNGAKAGDFRTAQVSVSGDCGGTTTTEQETTTTTEQETTTTAEQEVTTTTEQVTTTTTEASYPASVSVEVGYCIESSGVSLTPVTVTIEPAGSATVTISGGSKPIVITETAELMLEPGRYTWSATANSGYELEGNARGSFRTADCSFADAVVTVKVMECSYDVETGLSSTAVRVTIAPAGSADVVIEGPGGPFRVSGSGAMLDLAPGDYTWSTAAMERVAMVGLTSGSFTIEDCSPACTAVIGDYVWIDLGPRNGLQDEGEELVSGVVVHLLDSEGNVLATTQTDANGHYEFPDLCDGVYRVRFELPDLPGLVNEAWTTQGAGDAGSDSNADEDGLTEEIVVEDGTADMSWDAGIVGDSVSVTTVTTVPSTTSTTQVEVTTTTVAPTTSTTAELPASTTTTVPPVTATTLPFTGFELQTTAMLGLLAFAGGAALLMGVRRREEQDGGESLGGW